MLLNNLGWLGYRRVLRYWRRPRGSDLLGNGSLLRSRSLLNGWRRWGRWSGLRCGLVVDNAVAFFERIGWDLDNGLVGFRKWST